MFHFALRRQDQWFFHKHGYRFERQLHRHVPLCSLLIEETSSLAAPMACSPLQQAPCGDSAELGQEAQQLNNLDRGGRVQPRLSTWFKEAAVKRSMPMTSSRSSAKCGNVQVHGLRSTMHEPSQKSTAGRRQLLLFFTYTAKRDDSIVTIWIWG